VAQSIRVSRQVAVLSVLVASQRDEVLEVAGEAGAVAGERDALDVDAVLGAAQPPQPGVDLQPPDPEIEMPPARIVVLATLAIPRQIRALRALKATTAQHDRDHHPAGLEAHRTDPHPRQSKAGERMRS